MPASNYLVIQTPGDPIIHGPSSGSSNIHSAGAHGTSTAATSQLNSPSSGGQPPPFGPAGSQGNTQGHGGFSGGKGATVVSSIIHFHTYIPPLLYCTQSFVSKIPLHHLYPRY